jgi:polar amino acid transport system substrate-binding protein
MAQWSRERGTGRLNGDLSPRRCRLIATDSLISYFMKQNPGLKKVATGISPVTLGIGVAQDNKELAGKVRKALQAMKTNGTYGRLLKEWGIQDAAIDLQ